MTGELLDYLDLPPQLSGQELRERAIGAKFLCESKWLASNDAIHIGGELFVLISDLLTRPPAVVHRSDESEKSAMNFIDYRTSRR